MGTSRTTGVCCKRCEQPTGEICNEMQCDGHIAHYWCVLQEMRAVNL